VHTTQAIYEINATSLEQRTSKMRVAARAAVTTNTSSQNHYERVEVA